MFVFCGEGVVGVVVFVVCGEDVVVVVVVLLLLLLFVASDCPPRGESTAGDTGIATDGLAPPHLFLPMVMVAMPSLNSVAGMES